MPRHGEAVLLQPPPPPGHFSPSQQAPLLRPPKPAKVSLLSFVLHEHSLLGLLAPESHIPPPIKPCCCCCLYTDSLSRRHRLLIFAFVLAMSTALSVQVLLRQPGDEKESEKESWDFHATVVMIFCVTPLTCHLKSNLRGYSAWLQANGLGPFAGVRCEELLLLAACCYALVTLGQTVGTEVGLAAVKGAAAVWWGAMVSELFCCLPALYIFGRCCCCCCDCCVPRSYLLDPEDAETGSGGAGGRGAGNEPPSVVYMHSDASVVYAKAV